LRGNVDVVAIAYAAHVVYALVLGSVVSAASTWRDPADSFVPFSWLAAAVVVVLVSWQRPWTSPAGPPRAAPAAAIIIQHMQPTWVRIRRDGCVELTNGDGAAYRLSEPTNAPVLQAGGVGLYCFRDPGVKRVQLSAIPFSGGFVLVDPSMAGGV